MLKYELHGDEKVLAVTVAGPLSQGDFKELTSVVDPFIEEHGPLQGLMIVIPEFPDWENLAAAISHFRFVRDHHQKIRKVALVSDSPELVAIESIAKHFVDAHVQHFPLDKRGKAHDWLIGP